MDHQVGSLKNLFRPKEMNQERVKSKNLEKTGSAKVQKMGSKVILASHNVRNTDAESSQGKLGQVFSNMLVSLKNVIVGNILPESISHPRFSSGKQNGIISVVYVKKWRGNRAKVMPLLHQWGSWPTQSLLLRHARILSISHQPKVLASLSYGTIPRHGAHLSQFLHRCHDAIRDQGLQQGNVGNNIIQ